MRLEQRKLSDIKPYWRNPRVNDTAVEAVKRSIQEYGYNVPIVIDRDNVIILGHTRWKALRQLYGDDHAIEVIVLDIPPEKAKEFRIVDNQTHTLSTWRMDYLLAELRELNLDRMQLYFPDLNLESLLTAGTVKVQGGAKEEIVMDPPEEITEEDIDEAEEELMQKFVGNAQEREMRYVKVTCPHCMKEFTVSAKEVEKMLDIPVEFQ